VGEPSQRRTAQGEIDIRSVPHAKAIQNPCPWSIPRPASKAAPSGVLINRYVREGAVRTGSVGPG